MTPIKAEDRPKAIALSLAVLAVFGIGGANIGKQLGIFRSGAPAPTPATADAGAPSAPVAGPGTTQVASTVPVNAAGGPLPNPGAATYEPGVPQQPPVDNRVVAKPNLNPDPFRPVAPDAGRPSSPPVFSRGTPTQPTPAQAPPANSQFTVIQKSPSATFGGGTSGTPMRPTTVQTAPVTIPEPTLELIGVAVGEASVAMIQAGEQQHFVRVGEKLLGYWVKRIETDVVTLTRGNKERILRVGAGPGEVVMAATRRSVNAASPAPYDEPAPARVTPRRAKPTTVAVAPPAAAAPPAGVPDLTLPEAPPAVVPPLNGGGAEEEELPAAVPPQEAIPVKPEGLGEEEEVADPPTGDPLPEVVPPVVPPPTSPPPAAGA